MKCLSLLTMSLLVCTTSSVVAAPITVLIRDFPRAVNGYPDSTLTVEDQDGSSIGSGNFASIIETAYGAGSGFNRHEFQIRGSGVEASIELRPLFETSLTFQSRVVLSAGSTATRKEAGIYLDGDFDPDVIGDDGIFFMINSDGQIVAEGTTPYEFSPLPGEPVLEKEILLGVNIDIPSLRDPNLATVQYFIDQGAGVEESPVLPLDLDVSGAAGFQIKLYGQAIPDESFLSDTLVAEFRDIEYDFEVFIPEPSLAVLAIVGTLVYPFLFGRHLRHSFSKVNEDLNP